MSRIRSKGHYGFTNVSYDWSLEPHNGFYANAWKTFSLLETMEDYLVTEHRYHDVPVTQRVSPVRHVRWIYSGANYQPWIGDYGSSVTPHDVQPPLDIDLLRSMLPVFSDPLHESLNLEAFNSFSTQFPQEMSLGEFTVGLSELKQLLPKLQGDFLKDVAALHLTNEFGWQSLLSDIEALGKVVQKTRERLEWLRKTYGQPSRLGFSRKDFLSPSLGSELIYEPIRSWGVIYRLKDYSCVYHAGATLRQFMTHVDDAIGMIRGLTGAFGLDNPIKTAWELIPFSFVVDYFFKVSTHLDRLTRVQPAEPWQLSRATNSFKQTATWEVFQMNTNQLPAPVTNPQPRLGLVIMEDYQRDVGLPVSLATLSPESLTPDQLVLLLAIFAGSK